MLEFNESSSMQPLSYNEIVHLIIASQNVDAIRRKLELEGVVYTDPAFQLIKPTQGLDILADDQRIVLYPTDTEDTNNYHTLEALRIPQFPRIAEVTSETVTVLQVPYSAMRLDSIPYREEVSTEGAYFGAVERMLALRQFLDLVRQLAGSLPVSFDLSKAAFIKGESNGIRLIPPIKLSADITFEQIAKNMRIQLIQRDPSSHHDKQIEAFLKGFKGT